MIVSATPRIAGIAPRLRGLVLVLVALFVAHDAVYVARFGPGAGYAQAMAANGHDGYWLPASLVIAAASALAFLGAVAVIGRLRREPGAATPVAGPSYVAELLGIWPRLLVAVAVLFMLQENAEALVAHGHLVGIDPLFGPQAWLVPPVLAATTFLLAAVGAVLRWRVRTLRARIAAARAARSFARVLAATPAGRWLTSPAASATGRLAIPRDAGRAPPLASAQLTPAA